jgi:hypothetical protein
MERVLADIFAARRQRTEDSFEKWKGRGRSGGFVNMRPG